MRPSDLKAVAELVDRLADGNQAVREGATSKLIAMGDDVVPNLELLLRDKEMDIEARARIRIIIESFDLLKVMLSGRYKDFGWASGFANDGDDKRDSFFRITRVVRSAGGVAVSYDWQEGVMELHQDGRVLSGRWVQGKNTGPVEFTFDERGKFISGRWLDDNGDGRWHKAFLR